MVDGLGLRAPECILGGIMETLLFIAIVCVLGAWFFNPSDWGKWK